MGRATALAPDDRQLGFEDDPFKDIETRFKVPGGRVAPGSFTPRPSRNRA